MSDQTEIIPPQFTAMILCERHVAVSFNDLAAALKRIAPAAVLGDWSCPITTPADGFGTELLSLDGQQMAVLAVDAPAPAISLDFGPLPNLLWPDPSKEMAKHRAHVMIVAPGEPANRAEAIVKARAVTLVAAGYAALVRTIGVVWVDAGNLVPPAVFTKLTEQIGAPDGIAVPFWVRVKFAPTSVQSGGSRAFVVGTAGLSALCHPELEYAPSPNPLELSSHALATAQYLLSSGASLKGGQTIGVDGQKRYDLKPKVPGMFTPGAVITLEAR
ncbi:MAG: DUF4261 domain-containing protein [Hyphomicrobiaceae bacterium]